MVVMASLAVLAVIAAVPFLVGAVYVSVTQHRFFARTPLVADLGGPLIVDEERHFAER